MKVLFFLLAAAFYNYLSAQVTEQRCNTEDADSATLNHYHFI
jgi:hypothetical protein